MPEKTKGKPKRQRETKAEEKEKKKKGPKQQALSPQERAEKLKQAQAERREKFKQQRREQLQQKKQQQEKQPEEEKVELELDNLVHQISLEDLEQYLGITIVPEDKVKLQRRWAAKLRDASLKQLVSDKKAMKHPYALLPRLSRYFKGGKPVQTSLVNLLRSYPQLFENVPHIINKYKGESFFAAETPELDWVIIACEAVPESRNKNFMEQKTVLKQYASQRQTNERRIGRRSLIDALYDIIVINLITQKNILSQTVDLTTSSVGRQNFAIINFGEKGMRINDVSRQQRFPQMGFCPIW